MRSSIIAILYTVSPALTAPDPSPPLDDVQPGPDDFVSIKDKRDPALNSNADLEHRTGRVGSFLSSAEEIQLLHP